MKKFLGLMLLAGFAVSAEGQRLLNLDSCRAMALRNNKQMGISKVKREVATNLRKSARTKYLPRVTAVGGYLYSSKEVSLLNDEQKAALGGAGTAAAQMAGALGLDISALVPTISAGGQSIIDAFHTDTHNMFVGSVMLTQPIFMGGSIIAANKMADLNEDLAESTEELSRHKIIYDTDQAYWQVVSLKHKKKLAESYRDLVKKFSDDVQKMIREGVATRSEGLSVDVKVNEAEMTVTQVSDGLVLSKMLLCQLCGMPLEEDITLADEDIDNLSGSDALVPVDKEAALANRPELKSLQTAVDMTKQSTNIIKAGQLPQVALIGGYTISNPNVYNGFERKFAGMWNVGVVVRIPVWNWGDVAYKVRASKGAATMANLELEDAKEKVELQVSQSSFKVNEAAKKLEMAEASTKQADENLRCANLGFKEGVIQTTTVMEAQTAWLKAQSQKIDAQIDVKLSQVNLKKALGSME